MTALVEHIDPGVVESVLLHGDLKRLTSAQKIAYYNSVCQSLGLNPLTQPFAYIVLNGREVLYAKREATEQLRKLHDISIEIKAREVIEGCYVVTAAVTMPSGRRDESTGAVAIESLKGEARANALLKAETKAKRRATLSICGLGMLDETEVETIPRDVIIEAPRDERAPAPDGTVYLEKVVSKQWGAEVTLSTGEVVHARGQQLIALIEQLAQEGQPVTVDARPTPKGKIELVAVHRWPPKPTAALTDAKLDAEIAAKDAAVL